MNNEIEALTFIGKAFPDAMMDSNASFGGCNQSVEEDEASRSLSRIMTWVKTGPT